MFHEVDNKINFPQMEQQILQFWKKNRIFEKSVQGRNKTSRYVFYEGPPTVNGSPGIHHVLSRLYKDVICRYKTMQGCRWKWRWKRTWDLIAKTKSKDMV